MKIRVSTSFKKDLKTAKKRGLDLEKFVGKDGLRRFKSNAFGNRRNTQIPEGTALTIPQVQPPVLRGCLR